MTNDDNPQSLIGPWTAAEFDALVEDLCVATAPRFFATVQEYGERFDARVAAWGMSFDDHARVITVDGGIELNLRSAESSLRYFSGENITTRLIWLSPEQSDEISVAGEGSRT